MKLYSYWRSTAAYRVRIALNLKQLEYEYQTVHLVKNGGEQHSEAYRSKNPQGLVPALELQNGEVLTQSLAIIDYLDEIQPENPLYPSNSWQKAQVQAMSQSIACDIHPLNNLRVLQKLKSLELGQQQVDEWYHHWIHQGFSAIEKQLESTAGRFCFADAVTVADICLVAQVYNANRFQVDLSSYPLILKVNEECLKLPEFENAVPENQPDCDL